MKHVVFGLLLGIVAGCGPSTIPPAAVGGEAPASAHPAVKMRHQILFSSATRSDVFEGYMVLFDDAFFVKAFAGPGVTLFTIAHKGSRRRDTLHIEGLADRIDIERVGSDIHRVYLYRCPGSPVPASRKACNVGGERVEEKFDAHGRIVQRRFPDAHRIGLTATYAEYTHFDGLELPKKITLEWGGTENRMVIVLLTASPAESDASAVLEDLLQGKE